MMKINTYPLLIIILIFASCASAPSLSTFIVGDGIYQYFLPPTEWNTNDTKDSKAKLDVTYRTGPDLDTPATVNISFLGKQERPQNIGAISLHGAGVDCPLENVKIIFTDDNKKEYRITSQADRDLFIALLNAEPVALKAEVDGFSYTYTPRGDFLKLKAKFLLEINK